MSDGGKPEIQRVRRKDQARATRRRIVEAALERFVGEGYAATTLDSIAADAGVSVQTVYFHFGSKRNVLKEGVDMLAVGDDLPIPLLERPWMQELHATPDPHRALKLWMDASRDIYDRISPVMRIIRDAAGADPDMAAQWDANQQQRVIAHRALAEALAAKNGLRDGMTVDRATDVLYSLMSPEMYGLLVGDRGWAVADWQELITGLAAAAVLGRTVDVAGTPRERRAPRST